MGRSRQARRLTSLPLVLLAVSIALVGFWSGCGDAGAGSDPSGSGSGAVVGCLDPDEVQAEVNQVADGFEASAEEVKAKQQEIRVIEAEAC